MAKSRELYVDNRRMAGPLTNWNYLKRTSGVFHSTHDEDFKPLSTDAVRSSVKRSYAPVRFPQGSFSSCDYPTTSDKAVRPMLLNTWHDREWALDNKSSFEQSLVAPTETFLAANPEYLAEGGPACLKKTTHLQNDSASIEERTQYPFGVQKSAMSAQQNTNETHKFVSSTSQPQFRY